jgi:hypothetical protein
MEQMPFRWSLLRLLLRLQPHCGAVGTTVEALSRHFHEEHHSCDNESCTHGCE